MPITTTYPGVYIEEISSGIRTITGVATSIAAFLGRAARGPVNEATTILSFGDYERTFGGLDLNSEMSFAVQDFFSNGGSQAIVVRLFRPIMGDKAKASDAAKAIFEAIDAGASLDKALDAAKVKVEEFQDPKTSLVEEHRIAKELGELLNKTQEQLAGEKNAAPKTGADLKEAVKDNIDGIVDAAVAKELIPSKAILDLPFGPISPAPTITLEAASEGAWGADLRATVLNSPPKSEQIAQRYGADDPSELFDLQVNLAIAGGAVETIFNLTFIPESPRFVVDVLERESQLVRWRDSDVNVEDLQTPLRQLSNVLAEAKKQFDKAVNDRDEVLNRSTSKAAEIETSLNNLQMKREAYLRTLPQDELSALAAIAQGAKDDLQVVLGSTNLSIDVHDGAVASAKSLESAARQKLAVATTDRAGQATNGDGLNRTSYFPVDGASLKLGLYALETVDLFNLLCLPTRDDRLYSSLLSESLDYCFERRAMLIVDPPAKWQTAAGKMSPALKNDPILALANDINLSGTSARNAVLFYPRLRYPNSLHEGSVEEFPPCGVVAGIFARTDAQRGVWKAPAGLEASLNGVPSLSVSLTDAENGLLNPVGINCLRSFPSAGRVIWGSRTLRGADQLADEYKYVPVRRTALFLEESLYRGTQWVVFEPNDESLWAQIRLNIGSFLHDLFRQGAFQGRSPRDAYFVKCDKETTTQSDINKGIVNVVVGFAPLKPAEFVLIRLQQIAGQPDQ